MKSLDDGSIDLIALVAMELNRHYICFEANQDYIDIAETLISEKNTHNRMKMRLLENYLDDIYQSGNFLSWFKGSKMVDANGRPLLLGHATRNFGFNRFNTRFIHLSTINDASYFSGHNKRLFKFKNTLNKLSAEEIVAIYNDYFTSLNNGKLHPLDASAISFISNAYNDNLRRLSNEEEIAKLKKYHIDANEEYSRYLKAYKMFLKFAERYVGKMYFKEYSKGLPRLIPSGPYSLDNSRFNLWFKGYFMSIGQIKKIIMNEMFKKDAYEGKGGVYPLCAKVVNPFYIDCNGNSWDRIYIHPENCTDYEGMFMKYNELGWNKRGEKKGSWFSLDNEAIAILAYERGYDGVIFKNIREGAYGNVRMDATYIVFSTKQLKSPFENNGQFGDVENIYR